jgi:hypothetical protein
LDFRNTENTENHRKHRDFINEPDSEGNKAACETDQDSNKESSDFLCGSQMFSVFPDLNEPDSEENEAACEVDRAPNKESSDFLCGSLCSLCSLIC